VIVVLDPAPMIELQDAPSGAPSNDVLLGNVSWITPNETEAEALTGIAPTDEAGAKRAAEALRSRGVDRVAITLGPRGCFYAGPDGTLTVPAPHVDVVDTVGAGDAFNGALTASIVTGREPAEILRRACTAGAIACTRKGALPSLPTAAELEVALAEA
jgi:ribokinase